MGKSVHVLQLRLTMQFNSILYSILYLSSFATRGQHCRELCTFQLHI